METALDSDLDYALRHIDHLSPEEQNRIYALLERREKLGKLEEARKHFLPFVKLCWPEFIEGAHHRIMADAFERVANGQLRRLIINMPPRMTKSEFASWLLPAWFLGINPKKKIIQASNTEALAAGFGRRVRNLIDNNNADVEDATAAIPFNEIFPGVRLAKDSQAAAGWHTSKGGEYFAIGVKGKVTGKGGDIVIIDDPHSEQEAKQAESNPDIFDDVYEWFTSGPRQRLQPGGAIIVVMCMTGDTPVLRPDGSETPLADLRPGDAVATYAGGAVTTARVANWQSNGFDDVYTIQTQSGRLLRANARHPFLVDTDGERQWVRLQDLTPGMSLVATKAAQGLRVHKTNPGFATPAKPQQPTTGNTPMPPTASWGSTESGRARPASSVEMPPQRPAGSATHATLSSILRGLVPLKRRAGLVSPPGTGSPSSAMRQWWQSVVAAATSVVSFLTAGTHAPTGMASSASTTTTKRGQFEGFSATTATSPSAMGKPLKHLIAQPPTFGVTADEIVSITPSGRAEVFDVEIEGTENFIANGVVSHNTRWSKRDLTGQVIKRMQAREEGHGGDKWEVIEFPAILDEGTPKERSLWPGFWPLDQLAATRLELPVSKWKAQYQQQPTSEEGAIIKRENWKKWGFEPRPNQTMCPAPYHAKAWRELQPPSCDFIMLSIDTAMKKTQRADYSAFTTWGVFKAEDRMTGRTNNNLILLSAWKDRLEFPELKLKVRQFWNEDQPDIILIEDKGSGISLIQELRAMDVPVENFSYGRGAAGASNDKVARANMVSDIFASGYVWAPERRFADEVIEECAEFPYGDHDDYVDSVVQALLRFRSGGFITTANDRADDEEMEVRYKARRFY